MSLNSNGILLSFCIPAYNQSDLLKACIAKILEYKGSDIEVIVSDDVSTENIKSIVEDFSDSRVKYIRNKVNLGHDLNIINSFRHASGDFAFLLRTRDYVIPEAIPRMLEVIVNNPNASYFTGTALFPNGKTRLAFKDKCYLQGDDAVAVNQKLFIHPSGQAYSLGLLDLDLLETHIKKYTDFKASFLVHNLMRTYLAEKGDFITIEKPIWVYSLTIEAKDTAVNSAKSGLSPNDPSFGLQRYSSQLRWMAEQSSGQYFPSITSWLYSDCLFLSGWVHKGYLKDKRFLAHYSIAPAKTSISETSRMLRSITQDYLQNSVPDFWEVFSKRIPFVSFKANTKGVVWYILKRASLLVINRKQ